MKSTLSSVYVSSSCFKYQNLYELLSYCENNKFTNLELTGSLLPNGNELDILNKYRDNFNFLIHNYFPPPKQPFVINLASESALIREKSLDHCYRALKLCEELGIPFFSVHAGFLTDLNPQNLGADQTKQPRICRIKGLSNFYNSINKLLAKTTVKILVENNVNSRENLINDKNGLYLLAEIEETLNFFKDFNHPQLGLLVDLGHLNVSAQQLKFDKHRYLKLLKSWIKAFHLSSNNGLIDQGLAFNKDEWFIDALKKFPKATKIIEINNQVKEKNLRNCIKIIDNL